MNPTLRKFIALAEKANLNKGSLKAKEHFIRLVRSEPSIAALNTVTRGLEPVNKMKIGDLVTFSYYAKYSDELPFWDRYPLVLITSINKDGWTGINLHYLHPYQRARILYERDRYNTSIIDNEIANLCVKKYLLSNVQSRPRRFPDEYFEIAIQLPFENFQKASNSIVWNNTLKKRKK